MPPDSKMNNADVAAPVFSMGKEGKGKQDIQKTNDNDFEWFI